ncbi:MAG TPA: carbohydrate kinase, partial [Candidatus Angelobacter sp.]|nr:carbohydrate kinase [Candidatus Angelobacter sp.]
MQKNKLVVCVGELLIDFFCTDIDVDLTKGNHFLKGAGGAPANVTAAIAKLGGHAAFSGKVGKDPFGYFLKQTLDEVNVDTSMLVMDETAPTTLAFVSLKKNGERDFVFNRGADGLFNWEDVQVDLVKTAKILHFGSATALLGNPFQETYLRLIEEGRASGQFISFDPNYRGDLWKGRQNEFIALSQKAISLSDF